MSGDSSGLFLLRWLPIMAFFSLRARNIQRDTHYKTNDCATYRDFHELLARRDIDAYLTLAGGFSNVATTKPLSDYPG